MQTDARAMFSKQRWVICHPYPAIFPSWWLQSRFDWSNKRQQAYCNQDVQDQDISTDLARWVRKLLIGIWGATHEWEKGNDAVLMCANVQLRLKITAGDELIYILVLVFNLHCTLFLKLKYFVSCSRLVTLPYYCLDIYKACSNICVLAARI